MIIKEHEQLKIFMEREGYSQADIAKLWGKDQPYVSKRLSGIFPIPLAFVKILHLKCGLNYQWFFHNTGTMKVSKAEKRNIMTDLTDIQAALGMIMASQDKMRDDFLKLYRDFYAQKHGVN
jgi:transcriptional regulator with XRE-family HTH domain